MPCTLFVGVIEKKTFFPGIVKQVAWKLATAGPNLPAHRKSLPERKSTAKRWGEWQCLNLCRAQW